MDEIRRDIDRGDMPQARQRIDVLLAREALGRRLTGPWSVVLAGRANVGKSSLLNALAGYRRAIVHPAPGTTRDAVAIPTAIDGWPVELCDTAGLRATDEAVEQAGIDRARQRLGQADLVVLVADRSVPWLAEDRASCSSGPRPCWFTTSATYRPCPASGRRACRPVPLRGEGIEVLLATIARRLVPDPPPPGAAVPFLSEQAEMLRRLGSAESVS